MMGIWLDIVLGDVAKNVDEFAGMHHACVCISARNLNTGEGKLTKAWQAGVG